MSQRALADGEGRLGPDPDQAGLVLAVAVEVGHRERRQRGPGLPARGHVLPLVLADRAVRRRRLARGELGTARSADEGRHSILLLADGIGRQTAPPSLGSPVTSIATSMRRRFF
jgi:hypothetical protein